MVLVDTCTDIRTIRVPLQNSMAIVKVTTAVCRKGIGKQGLKCGRMGN